MLGLVPDSGNRLDRSWSRNKVCNVWGQKLSCGKFFHSSDEYNYKCWIDFSLKMKSKVHFKNILEG
jgi:hypothetical protein